jgi:hypothetical protein
VIAWAIGLGASILGYAIGRSQGQSQQSAPTPAPRVSGNRPRQIVGRIVPQPRYSVSAVEQLEILLQAGQPVKGKLVNAAFNEALRNGDKQTAQAIAMLFGPKGQAKPQEMKPQEQPPQQEDSPEELPQGESDIQSPIEHVSADDWMEFVSKLRSKEPSFRTDRHIGAFEHNRQRLKTLGIPDPTNEQEQYQALVADLKDHYNNAQELINEFSGDSVSINGTDQPITMSGIFALLKAGGVQGAEQWLRDPNVRAKYPRTNELFLKANGCF